MEEIGKIIAVKNSVAEIEITPTAACGRCGQANVCNPSGKNKKVIELPNTINAQIGDWVRIETKDKNRILSMLLVLGLPILLFITGVFIGARISGDTLSAILGGAGLVVAFIIVKLVNNYLLKKHKNLATIKEKVEQDTNQSCTG